MNCDHNVHYVQVRNSVETVWCALCHKLSWVRSLPKPKAK